MARQLLTRLVVIVSATDRRRGQLQAGLAKFPCAIGRGGVIVMKREGDGGTPRTELPLRRLFWRADRLPRIRTQLASRAMTPRDAWCDDRNDRRYNRLISRPEGKAEERLWRADHLYDIVVELGWNDRPVRNGCGSAIFWHLARPGFTPTAGCVGTGVGTLQKLLPRLSRRCRISVR